MIARRARKSIWFDVITNTNANANTNAITNTNAYQKTSYKCRYELGEAEVATGDREVKQGSYNLFGLLHSQSLSSLRAPFSHRTKRNLAAFVSLKSWNIVPC